MTPTTPTLAELQAAWDLQFPGVTHLILTLRQILVLADWRRLQIEAAFHQLELDLLSTHLPMHFWDAFTLRHYARLQQSQLRANRAFFQALRQLQAALKTPEGKPAPPPPPVGVTKGTLYQTIRLTTVDGQLVTTASPCAADFLRKDNWDSISDVGRQFYFPGDIPEPYTYVLTDLGVPQIPDTKRRLTIFYKSEEFKRICELEVATNSPHLLDGERYHYQWRD